MKRRYFLNKLYKVIVSMHRYTDALVEAPSILDPMFNHQAINGKVKEVKIMQSYEM
jgi:hypothetical protein